MSKQVVLQKSIYEHLIPFSPVNLDSFQNGLNYLTQMNILIQICAYRAEGSSDSWKFDPEKNIGNRFGC
jgi:hypothetical protein